MNKHLGLENFQYLEANSSIICGRKKTNTMFPYRFNLNVVMCTVSLFLVPYE